MSASVDSILTVKTGTSLATFLVLGDQANPNPIPDAALDTKLHPSHVPGLTSNPTLTLVPTLNLNLNPPNPKTILNPIVTHRSIHF